MSRAQQIDVLFSQARHKTGAEALLALGKFVTGTPCYVMHNGIGLRHPADLSPVTDEGGKPVVGLTSGQHDRALDALGLEVIHAPQRPSQLSLVAQVGVLVLRAGLLLRALDEAHAHLKPRESGGQKTLQLQLVKSCFTECFTLADQVRREAAAFLDDPRFERRPPNLDEEHRAISDAMVKASKLMGGHGYRLGKLNSLETLSFCIANVFSTTQSRSDAA